MNAFEKRTFPAYTFSLENVNKPSESITKQSAVFGGIGYSIQVCNVFPFPICTVESSTSGKKG